jgi:hypothetical protein
MTALALLGGGAAIATANEPDVNREQESEWVQPGEIKRLSEDCRHDRLVTGGGFDFDDGNQTMQPVVLRNGLSESTRRWRLTVRNDGTEPFRATVFAVCLRVEAPGHGPPGPQGPQGAQGPRGPRGPEGNNGTNGNDGQNGATGAQGAQGERGGDGNFRRRNDSVGDLSFRELRRLIRRIVRDILEDQQQVQAARR